MTTEFETLLKATFDGRLRIRWSNARDEWHIEQKVGRPIIANIDTDNDDQVRARDGYDFVMAVRGGDRMPCAECGFTLHVPVMDTWDIPCDYCRLKGRKRSYVAGYWPLNDRLINHLQKIDPLRDKQGELAEEADRRNRLLIKSVEDTALNEGWAYTSDKYNNLVGIPQVGYTGKEFRG